MKLSNISARLMSAILIAPALAAAHSWDPAVELSGEGWRWGQEEHYQLPAARLRARSFVAPLPPLQAAQRLQALSPQRFNRLQSMGAQLQLSGMTKERHWLAQFSAQDAGTSGMISALAPAPEYGAGFDASPLAPYGARQILQVASRSADKPGSLQAFHCAQDIRLVAHKVQQSLLLAGWRPSAESHNKTPAGAAPRLVASSLSADAALAESWRDPSGAQLAVYTHERAGGVVLIFWYRPGGAS